MSLPLAGSVEADDLIWSLPTTMNLGFQGTQEQLRNHLRTYQEPLCQGRAMLEQPGAGQGTRHTGGFARGSTSETAQADEVAQQVTPELHYGNESQKQQGRPPACEGHIQAPSERSWRTLELIS